MKKTLNILIIILFATNLQAQDLHFSQFMNAPLFISPTQSGINDGEFRVVANQKNQWGTVTVPYRTFDLSFDSKTRSLGRSKNSIGYGFLLTNDKAGDSEFGQAAAIFSLAFHKTLNRDSTAVISVGVNGGLNQLSINYSKLTFDNHWNGSQVNPNAGLPADLPNNKKLFLDMAAGINFSYLPNENIWLNTGFALWHVLTPNISLFENSESLLERKLNFHFDSEFRTPWSLAFKPAFLYSQQGEFTEIDFGSSIKFITNSKIVPAFYFGSYYRMKDAIFLLFALDYKNFYFGLSYDINTSKLVQASYGDGGFEFSLIYTFRIPELILPIYRACPDFM